MTILADRVQLAAKEEGTEGTAETLVGADALLVLKPVWSIDTPKPTAAAKTEAVTATNLLASAMVR